MIATVTVRRAHVSEAAEITKMVNRFAEQGLMLPKSLMQVYEHIREFVVALDEEGRVLGCGALRIMGLDLAEVRSLATKEEARGRGVGRLIVEALLREAEDLGLTRVFALTYQVAFFEKLGFEVVQKAVFPQKVWLDCKDCRKRDCCDEVAMLRRVGVALDSDAGV